jgi:phospholipid/cholesterol/gamma-HCH transport system substrate-binding protein
MARRRRLSSVTIGVIALIVIVVVGFLGFTKDIPFTRPFEVRATFQSANSIRPGSPVRIAGVDVGKVKAVEPAEEGSDAAVVVLEIDDKGLPLHTDATAKIRPRIFLEGNFFVDLKPGSPGAPELDDGGTLKVTQTATPVQLDEVLTSLQSDARQDLKDVLDGLAVALTSKPTAAENRTADPSTRGETAAKSLNDAYDDIPAAERSTAEVFGALLGTGPDDLSRLIDGTARTADALVRNEGALGDLITNFNTTMAALGSEAVSLRTSIRELPGTLEAANRALAALNEAFPPTRAFAREILPGVRETPATIDAAFPWIDQARPLMGDDELGGLARELAPATTAFARVTDDAIALLPQTNLASKCARDVILPTGDVVLQDEFTTGVENYKEFFYTLVGLAGEGQNFDGNGMYVRFQTGGGAETLSLGSASSNTGELFGHAIATPLGNRPFYPRRRPPYRPDAPCYKQPLPDLNGPAAAKSPPTGRAAATAAARDALPLLRKRLRPFGSREGTR